MVSRNALRNETVSVVVPCYNNRPHLLQTLSSILSQTRMPDELIIYDDRSDDGSWGLIRSLISNLERKIQRVKTKRQPRNLGISKNINSALRRAGGDWITLLAADDLFQQRKIELELRAALQQEVPVAYSGVATIDGRGNRIKRWRFDGEPPEGDVFVKTLAKDFFKPGIRLFRNLLIHKSVYRRVGYLDEQLKLYEDWDFQIRMTKEFKVAHSGTLGVLYRIHDRGAHNTRHNMFHTYQKKVILKHRNKLEELSRKERKFVIRRWNWMLNSSRIKQCLRTDHLKSAGNLLWFCLKRHPLDSRYHSLLLNSTLTLLSKVFG